MNRRVAWFLCLGFVGILAVSTAASTLPSAVSVVDEDATEPPEREAEALDEHVGERPTQREGSGGLPGRWLAAGAVVVGLLVLARAAVADPGRTAAGLLGAVAIAAALAGLLWIGPGGPSGAPGSLDLPEHFSVYVAAIAVCAGLIGSLAVLSRSDAEAVARGATDPPDEADPAEMTPSSRFRLTRLDVRSADAGENDVYRAWKAVADSVDARRRAETAGDVAAAAIECGYDRSAVVALTRLFEEVRYGGRDPTPERERRARELLDRLRPEEEEER